MRNLLCPLLLVALTCSVVRAQLRVVDGQLYNVSSSKAWQLFKGEFFERSGSCFVFEEVKTYKKLVSTGSSGGARYGNLIGGSSTYYRDVDKVEGKLYVKNFRVPGTLQNGQRCSFFALSVGTTNYHGEVIPLLDCGIDASPEILEARKSEVQALLSAQKKAIAEAKDKRLSEAETKIIANQLAHASNGYPSFQYDLAIRYATGNGLEKNPGLALHWLNAAMTNGSIEASNAFRKYFEK